MSNASYDYYVYVLIDPRNFEEFYYGKGKGSRKDVHKANDPILYWTSFTVSSMSGIVLHGLIPTFLLS